MKRPIILGIVLILLLSGLSVFQTNQVKSDKSRTNAAHSVNHYQANDYSPVQLNELLKKDEDKYAVIDVRSKFEYDQGHLPGAVHADFYDTEALKKAAGGKIPITYCAFSAMRGPYAAYQLYQAGFTNVSVLDGGISAWADDIQRMDSVNPQTSTVFGHPKNIFPDRPVSEYPKNQREVEFKIVARQFEFTPRQIYVRHGQKVTLHLVSLDVIHGFSLPEFGIEEELLPNEAVTVSFIADRKGNFSFVCSVICGAGHNHASMVGNIIVE